VERLLRIGAETGVGEWGAVGAGGQRKGKERITRLRIEDLVAARPQARPGANAEAEEEAEEGGGGAGGRGERGGGGGGGKSEADLAHVNTRLKLLAARSPWPSALIDARDLRSDLRALVAALHWVVDGWVEFSVFIAGPQAGIYMSGI
jgi:hypothetical protein